MACWLVYIGTFAIGFVSGLFANYFFSRLRRMCKKFAQCSTTIEQLLSPEGNSELAQYWCASVIVSVPKIRSWFADPMEDMLFGEVIIDEEGKGRSGGFRKAKWTGVQPTNLLEIPKKRGGKLLLLTESKETYSW